MYGGVMFRSRNEARWAYTFDALGIGWQYEPIDLNGYIPDFVMSSGLLVEIKPELDETGLADTKRKIEDSGWTHEAAILVPFVEQTAHQPLIGVFAERDIGPDGPQLVWGDCRIFRCLGCHSVSMLCDSGSWRCRECGADGGNAHVGEVGNDFRNAWLEAGNRVQWKAA
jgi:hypothetical protein